MFLPTQEITGSPLDIKATTISTPPALKWADVPTVVLNVFEVNNKDTKAMIKDVYLVPLGSFIFRVRKSFRKTISYHLMRTRSDSFHVDQKHIHNFENTFDCYKVVLISYGKIFI